MPYGDGMGPWWGQGNWVCRRGMGRGFGRGRGFGFYNYQNQFSINQNYPRPAQQYTKEDEIQELKSYAERLESELEEIKVRIRELVKK
ncbi:MAG: DUF5320 domain-containing protein [Candidatus Micrarchaeia archaeon]